MKIVNRFISLGLFLLAMGLTAGCGSTNSSDNSLMTLLSSSPLVLATTPANGATGVSTASPVVITFNKTINSVSVTSSSFSFSPAVTGTYSVNSIAVTIVPTTGFTAGTTYTVTIPSGGISDTDGYAVMLESKFTFTTE